MSSRTWGLNLGNTFWVYFKQSGVNKKSRERDYSSIYRHLKSIDQACVELKLDPLSKFHDFADLQDGGDQVSVKDEQWYEVSDGLKTVNGLLGNLPTLMGRISEEDNFKSVSGELLELSKILTTENENKSKFKFGTVT